MDNNLQKVLETLIDFEVAIVGGSIKNPDAKDIDVVFLNVNEFETACKAWGVRWAGWDANYGHVRRANVKLEGVDKPVQFVNVSSIRFFTDHPHILLMRGGTILNEDKIYVKPASGKYEKGIDVDRRKEGNNKWIAIDFDGTIRDWDTSKPFPGTKNAIHDLRERGYRIMIHSCNNPTWIEQWMRDEGIRFDAIWGAEADMGKKPIASLYIDDRGYHFKGNWTDEINDILNRLDRVPEKG